MSGMEWFAVAQIVVVLVILGTLLVWGWGNVR